MPENLREPDGKTDGELPMVSYNAETMAETMAEISGGCTGCRMLKKKDLTATEPWLIMVNKGKHPQMAELFRLVNHYKLPRCTYIIA